MTWAMTHPRHPLSVSHWTTPPSLQSPTRRRATVWQTSHPRSAAAAASPGRGGREFQRQRLLGRARDGYDEVTALAIHAPGRTGSARVRTIGPLDVLAVELNSIHRHMHAMKAQRIGACRNRPVMVVAALGLNLELDRILGLFELQFGALELTGLVVVAAPVVLVELELARLEILVRVLGTEAVDVDG